MSKSKFIFSAEEKKQIREAVENAEKRTSGEIVTFFVDRSDGYESAPFRAALLFITAALLVSGFLSYSWTLPFPITALEIIVFSMIMGTLGFILTKYIDPLNRIFIPNSILAERVEQRAMMAFLSEEVFNTDKRTGILILISHFEHMVEVIGDTGINSKVSPEEWQGIVNEILKGIKDKKPAEGIIKGVTMCGELLERAGVNKPPRNPNELPDDIRLG